MNNMELKLKQEPIIEYSAIDSIAHDVANKINGMDLENIEVSEENYKEIKQMRTNLTKEFKGYEEKRKLIKDLVMKPYNDFELNYQKISTVFKKADEVLKAKVNSVENMLLEQKVNGLKEYFNEINKYEWFTFDDLGIKINRSDSDKSKKEEISAIVEQVKVDIATIQSMDNNDRILAKYQISKDMNQAIAQVMQEIKIEELNKAKELEANEVREAIINNPEPPIAHEVVEDKVNETTSKEAQVTATFKVTGTLLQLKSLKSFMESAGIEYE